MSIYNIEIHILIYIKMCISMLHIDTQICILIKHTATMLCNTAATIQCNTLWHSAREVGGWGRDPKKCTGRDWGMGSSTIYWNLRPVVKYHLRRGVGLIKFLENGTRPQPPTSPLRGSIPQSKCVFQYYI